jgi:hypothetical protein
MYQHRIGGLILANSPYQIYNKEVIMDKNIKAILEHMEGYVPRSMQAGPDTPGDVVQPETPFDKETGDLAGIDGIVPDNILPETEEDFLDEDMMEAVMNSNGIKANGTRENKKESGSVDAMDLILRLM